MKPFVKWAGGKRQLLPQIRKYLPADISRRLYFEPFTGAGALLFDLRPERAVINDSNAELMLAFRVIRDDVKGLIEALNIHMARYSAEYFYEIRALNPGLLSNTGRAARFIFLNKTCYNGLYRVNSKGVFNVPVGRHKTLNICEEPLLLEISGYLNSNDIKILNADFAEAVSGAGENSFVYFDPPYHCPRKTGFCAYQAGGFGENDQLRLRDLFISLTNKNVPCLLSNADTPFIREIYNDPRLDVINVTARRFINSDQNGRGKVSEVLVANYRNFSELSLFQNSDKFQL